MSAISFTKMHGIGNDFVIIDAISNPVPEGDLKVLSKKINDRTYGIGGDGLILIHKGSTAPFRMQMLNPDGSESEMCGNGIRCVAKYLRDKSLTELDLIPIETGAGLLQLGIQESNGHVNQIRVDMGIAKLHRGEIPMTGSPNETAIEFEINIGLPVPLIGTAVSMGNPHCVIFVEDVSSVPLETWGPKIENHSMFPNRINVHFVQVVSQTELIQRTWERGAGATLACGTGACAVGVASFLTKRAERKVLIHLPGGDLKIEYAETGNLFMTGPAETVFEGVWDPN